MRVEVVALASPIPTMDVGLAWPANTDLPPAARAFAQFMRNAGRNTQPDGAASL